MTQSTRITDDQHATSKDASLSPGESLAQESDGGLSMLRERQRRDAEEVAAGRRSARSLWAVQKGDLEGFTFTPNPASEFDRVGEGW